MKNGIYYLNNNGSRWIGLLDGKKPIKVFTTKSGKTIQRTPLYYFSFGNFVGCCINYKGKRIKVLSGQTLED